MHFRLHVILGVAVITPILQVETDSVSRSDGSKHSQCCDTWGTPLDQQYPYHATPCYLPSCKQQKRPPLSSPAALLVLFSPGGASASGRASISTFGRCGGRGAGCWRVPGGAKRKDRALDSQLQASISMPWNAPLSFSLPPLAR